MRELAQDAGLPVYNKRDSTGICFIGERPFREFLEQHIEHRPGPLKTVAGETIGEHVGLPFYTLGQRGGIGIGGMHGIHRRALVRGARRIRTQNALIVAQGSDNPALFTRQPANRNSELAGHATGARSRFASRCACATGRRTRLPC